MTKGGGTDPPMLLQQSAEHVEFSSSSSNITSDGRTITALQEALPFLRLYLGRTISLYHSFLVLSNLATVTVQTIMDPPRIYPLTHSTSRLSYT